LAISSDANVVFWTTTDNFSEIYLNGVQVGTTTDWTKPFSFSLTGKLLTGKNVLAIAGHDSGGVARTNPSGWANAAFDDSSWLTPVAESQTTQPWGNKMPINDGSASWIWSSDPENHNDVYFRIGFVFNP
jgi:hypothetical protein